MFLNVLKGAYPGLQQVDLALPIASGETGIERGSFLTVNSDRKFEKAAAADAAANTFLYIALQDQDDLTAGMAGDVGQGAVSASDGEPVINALSIVPSMQIETDAFDSGWSPAVGAFAQIGDSGLEAHSTGNAAVAKVDAVAASRWVNNAVAVTGYRTGNNVSVITVTTLYIPDLV